MSPNPVRYLSRQEVAALIGCKPDALSKYYLPEPAVIVGSNPGVRGWTLDQIRAWHSARPSQALSGLPKRAEVNSDLP
jgi:hypothetical protein